MAFKNQYHPPYKITPEITCLVSEISEALGRIAALSDGSLHPQLRKNNRLKTIHASLAIENNSLTLEQITAIVDGKRVMGHPREIQEVRNALAAYDALPQWKPYSQNDLLTAHGLLMAGLADEAGIFRRSDVGIFKKKQLVHMAPPANRVPELMKSLMDWLGRTDEHPLVAGSVFHYELEFIHPFTDGNGRMGRLWHTLILQQWKPVLAWLPVETVIKDRQADYYKALSRSDKSGEATPAVEFLLDALRAAISMTTATDQVFDQVADQVKSLLSALGDDALRGMELMERLGLSHRPTFRGNYLNPAMAAGLIKRVQPNSPRSPNQRYQLTERGKEYKRNLIKADTVSDHQGGDDIDVYRK
ncbi:MAG: Fic family protein [Syntrophorhabdaceae bacterium]|nr:Fic family protein [Syntrophorhabdaceae bacterium]